MTLMKYDRFAIIPKRCYCCNRLFIFEPYNIHYKWIFATGNDYKYIKCKNCEIADREVSK